MSSSFQTRNRIIEVIRRGQRGVDGDVGLVTTTTKSVNFTAVTGERGYAYYCTNPLTASFEAAATLTNGWHCIIDAASGDVVLDPNGSETINGVATVTVPSGGSALVYTDGSALYARFFFGSAYTALNGLPTAANKYIYGTGAGVWAEGDINANGRDILANATAAGAALIDDASASAQLTTLGVTAFAQTLLDDADAATARATLGGVPILTSGTHTCTATPTTSGTVTLGGSQDAIAYVRIGKVVFLRGQITVSSVSSPVGSIDISIPFSVEALPESSGFHLGARYDSSAAAYIQDPISFIEGSSVLRWDNTVTWAASDQIIINDFYFTDAA